MQAEHLRLPGDLNCVSRRPIRFKQPRLRRAVVAQSQPKNGETEIRLPKRRAEELSASTVDGGSTLTEVGNANGPGSLAVPLSGVVLPEGLSTQEQRKRLWFAAVKPPMYTVALIPVLVSIFTRLRQMAVLLLRLGRPLSMPLNGD